MCTIQQKKWTKLTIWYTPWRCRMTSSSCFDWQKVENLRREWVELFSIHSSPFLLSICCVACNRSLKIRAWPRKKKLTNFSLFLLAPQKPMSWLTLLNFVRKKRWEGDNNSAVPVIKISPLMALALVVVIRSKKRVTTSSSDPFNKIFRRSVVCVSFFFIHSCQNYYTQKIFVTALFIVSGNFFFNVTRFNKLTCFFLETLIKI